MKVKCLVLILFLLGFSYPQEHTRGVVQTIEASFCMDFCSMYYLEPDSGFMATNLTTIPIIILEEYVGQHVEIWGEQTWCVECGALDVNEIILIEDFPLECTTNDNCNDCFDAGCFWQPVAQEGYQCNDDCYITDEDCYGSSDWWTAECPDDDSQIGDECYSDGGDLFGYFDCYHDCTPLEFWDWLGDGWCDEGPWRIVQFNCEELGFDCGDCNPDWDGTDSLGFCEEEITCTQGDITNDGDVNVLDVVSMVNIILQLPSEFDSWDFWLCAGDFNGDGSINVLDVILLVNLILNPISEDCYIIPEIGPCDGICPTYFYNQDTNQCEEFITGCCGVEAFDSQQSCQDVCEQIHH